MPSDDPDLPGSARIGVRFVLSPSRLGRTVWSAITSYAGMLLALFGFVLALGNWAGLFAMLVLAAAAFAYRITVEEAALLSTLGEPYARYMRRL